MSALNENFRSKTYFVRHSHKCVNHDDQHSDSANLAVFRSVIFCLDCYGGVGCAFMFA